MSKQYIVGGAVRDVLLGRTPKDLDYVWVGATPEEMVAKGMSRVGADFPVYLDDEGNEHALARKERKVDVGYNGFEVDFDSSVTLEDDLMRRDLTINAMAVPADRWNDFLNGDHDLVVDMFNGRSDLEFEILRHVSDAFAEDPVRVLRVARFAARYEFDVSLLTLALMTELVESGELDALVPERVWAEMEKALTETNPMAFLRTLKMCGALNLLLPELRNFGFIETCFNNTPNDALVRFALMTLKLSKAELFGLCDRLKVPNEFRDLAFRSSKFVNTLREELTAEGVVAVFETIGAFQNTENLNDVLFVANQSAYNTPEFQQRLTDVASASPDVLSVRFADLSEEQQTTLKGPAVGQALRELRTDLARQAL